MEGDDGEGEAVQEHVDVVEQIDKVGPHGVGGLAKEQVEIRPEYGAHVVRVRFVELCLKGLSRLRFLNSLIFVHAWALMICTIRLFLLHLCSLGAAVIAPGAPKVPNITKLERILSIAPFPLFPLLLLSLLYSASPFFFVLVFSFLPWN